MKKTFKSIALAAAFACSAPLAAQAQDNTPQPQTAAQKADAICAELAADADIKITCTAAQKTALAELIERVAAMPVTDRYSALAQQHAMLEGFRQIFFPDEPALPVPPKNQYEEAALRVCLNKAQQTGTGCTVEQYTQLTDFIKRLNDMAEPATIEEVQARQQFIRDELHKIFPEASQVQPQQQAPATGTTQLRRMHIA